MSHYGLGWRRFLGRASQAGVAVEPGPHEAVAALRGAVGVGIALFVALWWQGPGVAAAAAFGAHLINLVIMQPGYASRPLLALAATAALAAAMLTGGLAAPWTLLFLLAAGVWTYAAGLSWALGPVPGLVAITAVVGMLFLVPQPESPREVVRQALATAAGCLLQVVLVGLWHPRRWEPHREALAEGCASVADYGYLLTEWPTAPFDSRALLAARDASTLGRLHARGRPGGLTGVRPLLEQARALLAAVADPGPEEGTGASRHPSATAEAVLNAAAEFLDGAATAVLSGASVPAPAQSALEELLGVLEGDTAADPDTAATEVRLLEVLLRIETALEAPAPGSDARVRPPSAAQSLHKVATVLRASAATGSLIRRYALRATAVVVALTALGRALPVAHGYWAPMAAVLIMRPEAWQTYRRGAARMAGTVAGVAGATGLVLFVRPEPWVSGALAVLCIGTLYLEFRRGDFLTSVAGASYVVLLLALAGVPADVAAGERVGLTVLGALAVLVAYALFPAWQTTTIPVHLAEILEATGRYVADAFRLLARPDPGVHRELREALNDQRRAFADLRGAADAAEEEPVRPQGLSETAVTRCRRAFAAIQRAVLLLEARHTTAGPPGVAAEDVEAVEEFADRLASATDEGAAALLAGRAPEFTGLAEAVAGVAKLPEPVPRVAGIVVEALEELSAALEGERPLRRSG
ncbi:FUSC family protein [Streptomyces polyrhachis]|uniref:FUSC family protein n=1 Tax=Streptomyces polyrhachis TaxID=1282885 RepID=A0ABW2G9Y5_9ACTN